VLPTAGSRVCVVIPVHNEATVIADVVREVRRVYPLVVCVDDGSSDDSAAAIVEGGGILVQHPVNLGQGASLQTGIEMALHFSDVEYVVTFDGDGQHDIADVEVMLEVLESGSAQIVFGSRFLDARTDNIGWAKRAVLRAAVKYTQLSSGLSLTDAHNGLRAFTRKVAADLDLQMNGMAHASEFVTVVARTKVPYAEVPVHIRYTDYSRGKGQPLMNGVNIIFDLLLR
jgi:glycosyltransferase involved in cell wall biosynthesis